MGEARGGPAHFTAHRNKSVYGTYAEHMHHGLLNQHYRSDESFAAHRTLNVSGTHAEHMNHRLLNQNY